MFEKGIVIHHTAGSNDTFESVRKYHMTSPDRMYKDIGYNHFIEKDGTVKVGRGMEQGAHVKNLNHLYYGVAFAGNFEQEQPTEEQYKAGAELVAKLLHELALPVDAVYGHKDVANTVCPGRFFDMKRFKILVERKYGFLADLGALYEQGRINSIDYWFSRGDEYLPVWAYFAIEARKEV